MNPANFSLVKAFFESWDLAPNVRLYGLTKRCYTKLIREAFKEYGEAFVNFCTAQLDSVQDEDERGEYFLRARTWEELEESWNHAFPTVHKEMSLWLIHDEVENGYDEKIAVVSAETEEQASQMVRRIRTVCNRQITKLEHNNSPAILFEQDWRT